MNPKLFSWMNPKLEVRTTGKYGVANLPHAENGRKIYKNKLGLGNAIFANKEIKKNEILFVMGGYILSIEDENNLKGIIADKPIEISKNFSIGPRKTSDLPRMPQHYVNHSCNPNAGFDGQIFMVAMRTIKKDQEVTYDYAMVMCPNKESDSLFTFSCLCGSKNCREVISENDWKNSELQSRYNGYFQHYLQKQINKINKRVK